MQAREWLNRGKAAQSPIDAFTDYWRGFNNLYGPTQGTTELARLRAFLAASVSSAVAAPILADHPEQVAYLLSQPVIDMRGNGRDTAAAIAAFSLAADAQAKLCELFAVIYQVRCNLEHGQKSPTVDRDVRLCECSAPIVAAVVAHSV
jgi:hypothetical protein